MREVMHAALLLGYGASAINPYMAFAILDDLVDRQEIQLNYETAEKNYVKSHLQGFIQDYEQDGDQHDPQLPGERSFSRRSA